MLAAIGRWVILSKRPELREVVDNIERSLAKNNVKISKALSFKLAFEADEIAFKSVMLLSGSNADRKSKYLEIMNQMLPNYIRFICDFHFAKNRAELESEDEVLFMYARDHTRIAA